MKLNTTEYKPSFILSSPSTQSLALKTQYNKPGKGVNCKENSKSKGMHKDTNEKGKLEKRQKKMEEDYGKQRKKN